MSSILIADIGGTNGRFAWLQNACHPDISGVPEDRSIELGCRSFESFEDLLNEAVIRLGIEALEKTDAVFAIAGPVGSEHGHFTNLSWTVDARAIMQAFDFRSVRVINDLVSAVHGLINTKRDLLDYELLQAGDKEVNGRSLLLNAGTGLGAAYWSTSQKSMRVDGSEAGHIGFSPTDSEQLALFRSLHRAYGRVSCERVLSGSGLVELDAFLRGQKADSAESVVARATDGDETASRAIGLFSEVLGAYAGDLALAAPAFGGIWLTGGVLDGLNNLFATERFLDGFRSKGRMKPMLANVPVYRLREKGLGLKGAWCVASGLL